MQDNAPEAPTKTGLKRIPSLDGMRAIAILCVVWHHFAATLPQDNRVVRLLINITPIGDFGVQIFFVLSGFLITTFLLREHDNTGRISLKEFYKRRAYRILPAMYTFLAIVAILMATNAINLQGYVLVGSALFLRDYMPTGGTWWLGHMWTLAIEEQFYLLWPLALIFAFRKKLSRQQVAKWLCVAVAAVVVMRIGTYLFIPQLRGGVMVMFHTRADALMVGCALALLWQTQRFQEIVRTFVARRLYLVALVWLALSWMLGHRFGQSWRYTIGYIASALAIAAVLAWVMTDTNNRMVRMLNSRAMIHIGVISYSLYLYQQLFLTVDNTTILGVPGINLVCAFIAAEISYHLVEQPFLKLRARRKGSERVKVGATK